MKYAKLKTAFGTNLKRRIKQGKTTFFDGVSLDVKQDAEKFADQKGSYVYAVFGILEDENEYNHVGYGVPN